MFVAVECLNTILILEPKMLKCRGENHIFVSNFHPISMGWDQMHTDSQLLCKLILQDRFPAPTLLANKGQEMCNSVGVNFLLVYTKVKNVEKANMEVAFVIHNFKM